VSLLQGAARYTLSKIRGPASLLDQTDRAQYAEFARNCEYSLSEQVTTRRGFGAVWNPAKAITSLAQWILASASRLCYYNKTDGVCTLRNLGTGVETNILTGSSAETVDFASLGARLLFAQVSSAGAGAAQARVWDGVTAPASADKAFQPPLTSAQMSFSTSEPAAGVVSKGAHKLAVVFTTRTGYETRACPVTAGFGSSGSIADLAAGSVTASGNKTLRVQISPATTWPAEFVSAALLMTTVQNQARYFFVPGCTAAVTGGGAGSVTFPDVNLSDAVLGASSSVEAVTATKNYFALYSQDSSGNGPFSPFKVLGYSDRAVYIATLSDGTSGAFVSNKNAPQWITLSSHLIQLEEKRQMITAFVLGGVLYIVGPNWTYATSDNTSLPITWAPPKQIDGRIGTPSITGVAVNSSLGYGFVAHSSGLYSFQGGSYSRLPVSHLETPTWSRINWTAAQGTVQVLDFPAAKMVLVKAPLDGASTANALLVWSYEDGMAFDKVNFCGVWDSTAFPDIGAIAGVLNPSTGQNEIWLSRRSAGKVYRSKSTAAGDASVYNDDSAGFVSRWRSPSLPPAGPEPMQYIAFRTRLRGSGSIAPTAYSFDSTRTQALTAITASSAPGKWLLNLLDMQSEGVSVDYSNGGVADAWFLISGLEVYTAPGPWVEQR
jgi:hypothetical protein